MALAYAPPAEPMPDQTHQTHQTHQDGFTVEEWLALPESRQRIELIDGSYVVSPTARWHLRADRSRIGR